MGAREPVVQKCPRHLNRLIYYFLSRYMPPDLQSRAEDQIHSLSPPDRRFHAV